MDLFLVCILARLGLAYAATQDNLRRPLMFFLLGVATAWLAMSAGIVRRDRGQEAGGKIWWKHLRLLHAINYIAASSYLVRGLNTEAAAILVADVALGTFFRFRYRSA